MNIKALMEPKSIALVGASNNKGSLGYEMMQMVLKGGYQGKIYPINSKYSTVCDIPCYPDIGSCQDTIDLMVLSLSANRILDQIDIAIQYGIKGVVVFANCVLEEDPELENNLIEKCLKNNIILMGHNAMGFYNNDIGLRICGFDAPLEPKGNIAFISQSGSVFSTIGHNEPQLKFNLMVATGTGQITSLCDYMLYALDQPTTKVIGIYMESVRKPATFIKALKTAAIKKIPIVAMKVGKSELGAVFAKSHTGGLAGNDEGIQSVFDHYGVLRVDSLYEMANLLTLFSQFPKAPTKGGLVAIADSGGERNLLADDAEAVGLKYATLSKETMIHLQSLQEYGQEAANPLDPWGTGINFEKIFGDSFSCMLKDENAAIGLMSQDLRDGYYLSEGAIQALLQGKKESGKPVVFLTNFGGVRRNQFTAQCNKASVPVMIGTKPALSAIKKYLAYGKFSYDENRFQKKIQLSESNLKVCKNNTVLKETQALDIFKELGFPVSPYLKIDSLKALEKNKDTITFPAVLKTAEDGILHKADVGGVKLHIPDYETLVQEYEKMKNSLGNNAMVSPMMDFDLELILGMKTDPVFGPLIIVGAGGILTELLKDTITLTPLSTRSEIENQLKTLKTYPLLNGFRGFEVVDRNLLIDIILQFIEIAHYLSPWIAEIDINPLAIKGNHIQALDALMIGKA